VLFYWTTSNLWTMGQQFYVIRNNPAPGTEAERAKLERDKAKALKKGLVPTEEVVPEPEQEKRPAQRQQPQRQSRSQRKTAVPKPSTDATSASPPPSDQTTDPTPTSDPPASNGQAITPKPKKKHVPAKGAPTKAVPNKNRKKR
jgi:YidC/Oxa1 family membrane protein insertase